MKFLTISGPGGVLTFLVFVLNFSPAIAQKKASFETVEREKIKFERLYVDASKAKILGDFDQAEKLYEACIKVDPSKAAPYYELGNLNLHTGNLQEARRYSQAAAQKAPDNYYYRFLYSAVLKHNQEFELLTAEYEKMLTDFPDKMEIYLELAMVYVMRKEYEKAIAVYNKLEDVTGPNEELKLKKQYLYLQTGDVNKAVKEVEELIKMQPDNVKYYLLIAELYHVNGHAEKAKIAYQNAEERFPGNTEVFLSLADFYRNSNEIDKSLRYLKLAFADPALDVDLKIASVVSFLEIVNTNKSYQKDIEEIGSILLTAHPGDARVLTINGDIYLNGNQPKLARHYFSKAVEIDNSRYAIWNQLLILEADLGIFDTLAMHCEEAIGIFPQQALLYYFHGYAKSRQEMFEDAARSFENGLAYVIDNDALKVQFYLSMGDTYNELRKFEQSDKAFEAVIGMDSNNTIALNNYSYYLSVREEKLEQALSMSAKSNKLEPDNATYLDTYAWIYYKMGRYEEAKKTMDHAINHGGDKSGVILEHMGDILYKLNQADEATRYWLKAREVGGASDLIDRKIADGKLYE